MSENRSLGSERHADRSASSERQKVMFRAGFVPIVHSAEGVNVQGFRKVNEGWP